jgi:hypothetical protein
MDSFIANAKLIRFQPPMKTENDQTMDIIMKEIVDLTDL